MTTPAPSPLPLQTPEPEYVLGTGQAELDRLRLQHRLWSDTAHQLWRRAGLRPGHSVLDVGCGPGFAALDMAAIVGGTDATGQRGSVLGIDESPRFLAHLAAAAKSLVIPHLSTAQGDACELGAIPGLRPTSFDRAYTRWVLCFVKRPEAVAQGVHALLKPGGVWIIQDYFNYEASCTAPRSPAFAKAVDATAKSWRDRGGDPDIVARLPAILDRAGFDVTHLHAHQRIARPGDTMWSWPTSFWTIFVPTLVSMGYLTEHDHQQWLSEWKALSNNPHAFCLPPALYDLIAIKGA